MRWLSGLSAPCSASPSGAGSAGSAGPVGSAGATRRNDGAIIHAEGMRFSLHVLRRRANPLAAGRLLRNRGTARPADGRDRCVAGAAAPSPSTVCAPHQPPRVGETLQEYDLAAWAIGAFAAAARKASRANSHRAGFVRHVHVPLHRSWAHPTAQQASQSPAIARNVRQITQGDR